MQIIVIESNAFQKKYMPAKDVSDATSRFLIWAKKTGLSFEITKVEVLANNDQVIAE